VHGAGLLTGAVEWIHGTISKEIGSWIFCCREMLRYGFYTMFRERVVGMTGEVYKKIQRILGIILLANLAVAVLKIAVGSLIRSASMTADGFHSLTDGSSNIIGMIGIHLASKPIDEDHPYGHKKFETLAGLFIAGILFAIAGKIILDSILWFAHPPIPQISLESIIVLIGTMIVNILVCVFENKQGKKLNSQILISDAMHTRSDIYISIGVLMTLLGIKLGLPAIIDPVASLIVSGFILRAACGIFKSTSEVLVDKAALDTEKIRELVLSFEQVKDAHNIRSRGSKNDLHIDMHIMTEPQMSVEESHALIHAIEKKIQEDVHENTQVIVHLEPYHELERSELETR
jgi:cation diffusion facilitator family transporter